MLSVEFNYYKTFYKLFRVAILLPKSQYYEGIFPKNNFLPHNFFHPIYPTLLIFKTNPGNTISPLTLSGFSKHSVGKFGR